MNNLTCFTAYKSNLSILKKQKLQYLARVCIVIYVFPRLQPISGIPEKGHSKRFVAAPT